MKFTLSILAVFLFINSILASHYTATFDSFEGAVSCLSKNVRYIKKVSGSDVQVHGQDLIVASPSACGNAIQDNLTAVCGATNVTCQE